MKCTWGAGGGIGSSGWSCTTSHECGHPASEGRFNLLGADEMDVRVDSPSGEDVPFTSNRFGARPDHDGDAFLDVGVAGFADPNNAAILEADIGLDDAPPIKNQGIGNHGVNGSPSPRGLGLAHAIANHLPAAEFHLIAVGGEVLFHFEDEFGVR